MNLTRICKCQTLGWSPSAT